MRLAWAVVAGALVAGALAWWLGRDSTPRGLGDGDVDRAATPTATTPAPAAPGPVLYRWHDDAGVVQITDTPPAGRRYTVVDVAALERRNTIDPNPAIEAAR